jgi:DNA polymerase III subunit gamma/tau
MSLYRKYRPQSFDDLVGQPHVVSTLRSAVEQGKLAHAYLFSGSRGTGKTSVARILAKHMLANGIADEALKRQVEKGVEDGSLVDLTEIDAASNRGIDDVRGLLEKIQFAPAIAGAKVFIIDEVHMLTKEAFNALLKTLEEPPPYAYFILATTELHKIPATIQSRCQRFVFRQINEEDLVGRLRFVAEKESIEITDAALLAIARTVQGGMRDALSLLDQLRSLPRVDVNDVKERTGDTGHEHADAINAAIERNDARAILEVVRRMEETAVPFEAVARLMLSSVRNRLHAAVDADTDTTEHLRRLDVLLDALRDLRSAPVPALVLESALLSLCAPGGSSSASPAPAVPHPTTTPPAPKNPSTPASPVASSPGADATPSSPPSGSVTSLKDSWPEIVKQVEPASARMSLKNGRLKGVADGEVVVVFTSAFNRDKAAEPEAARTLEQAIAKHVGVTLKLRCALETDAAAEEDTVDLASEAAKVF